jgi:hypothetical protein
MASYLALDQSFGFVEPEKNFANTGVLATETELL